MKRNKILSMLMAVCMFASISICAYAENSKLADAFDTVQQLSDDNVVNAPVVPETNTENIISEENAPVETVVVEDTAVEEEISIFSDVSSKTHSWAVEAINSMAEKGFINGYSDGTFKPDKTVSKLEALSLVARILGVNDDNNTKLCEAGEEIYGDIVEDYELNFGTNEIYYLLSKNILTEDELNEYLDKSNVNAGMKRYEVAVLLTKALDANSEVSKNLLSTLTFDDADDIPAYAKKYIEYVVNNGLMSGVGANKFSPNTDVSRAQAAILMNKLLAMTEYTFKSGMVAEYDNSSRVVRIKSEDETIKYSVNADVKLRFEGVDITVNDIVNGYDAIITLKKGSLYAIDFTRPLVDKEIKGVVSAVSTGKKNNISVIVLDDNIAEVDSSLKETFPMSDNVVVSYNNEEASLKDIKSGTMVKLVIKKGEIVAVSGYEKSETVSGRVTNIEITPTCKMTIETASGDEVTYLVSGDVEVSKNGKKAAAYDVVSGDSVSVTTTYERITKIVASSKQQTKSGIIQEVIIAASPKITLKSSDGNVTYNITNNCVLDLPGITSPTFYDLRVGVAVELVVEGDTVVKLSSNITEGISQISGVVSSVNAAYAVIQVTYVDSVTGISVTEPVFVKTKATIIDILTGNSLKLNAIKTGSKITAFGVRNSGVFEATTVNVTNN